MLLNKNKEAIFKVAVLKRTIQKLGIIIQKVIISILLFIVYYLVFGLTVVIAFLFNRRMLTGRDYLQYTTWLDANGYDEDMLSSKKQS